MKPVYCNNTAINFNPKTGEATLSFSHIYTEHNMSFSGGGFTDVSAKMVEEEAHVIMSREAFFGLKRAMDKIFQQMDAPQGD